MAALSQAKRVVIKIGSALLVDVDTGLLRQDWLDSLVQDVAALKARGVDVVLVSSGSIALGRGILGLGMGALTLDQSQAAAAVGQIRLAGAYQTSMDPNGITTAQILVTLEDSADRRRYLNARATLLQLLSLGVVPIVNENDTVATDEIRYGDNDRLAAQIAVTVGADVLVLLSDVDGFYTANPADDPTATRFETVTEITTELEQMAGDVGTGLSKGGMKTKLMAAKTAMGAGCAMAITLGSPLNPIATLENGANATWFQPLDDPQTARKRWISAMKPKGTVVLDAGAVLALSKGKSLLPAGVTDAQGEFGRGDAIAIQGHDGQVLGCGLTRFTMAEVALVKGHQTAEFEALLGHPGRSVLIHRDDMVV